MKKIRYSQLGVGKMKIGIIDADLLDNGTRHPNLALMKLSGYNKAQGHSVELLDSYDDIDKYERVYVSKVFKFTDVPEIIYEQENVILGGTGFYHDGGESLPYEVEHHMPDYSLYKDYIDTQIANGKSKGKFEDYLNYSIGFTTRGCFRKCEFCVNKKYDRVIKHSPIEEFLNPEKPYIYLWDDNFLAFSGWEEVLNELESTGKYFQFRQGLDIRLMNDKKARRFSNTKYHGDFIFAFDHIEERELIEKKLKLWKRHSSKTTKLYVLCAYDSQDKQDIINTFERIKILMKYGCLPYIMRYEDYEDSEYRDMYIQLARWCNQPSFFKKKSFRQFCEANQKYHKTKDTYCSSYKAMIDFERKHPEIASTYFDLRFDDLNEYNNSFGYGRKYAHKNDCEICEIDQKKWLDSYYGVIKEKRTLLNYFLQEMDLQCLSYSTGLCREIDSEEISSWFINVLLSKSVKEILDILKNEKYDNILPCNIPQFSQFMAAVIDTPNILINMDDGITFEDLGYYLERTHKSKAANKKYGENHSKFATLLDLAAIHNISNKNYIRISELGKSYLKLSYEDKIKLVVRLLLRIPIVQHVLRDASQSKISLVDYMSILSEKTMIRRRTDVIEIFNFIKDNSFGELDYIFSNIKEIK